MRHYAVINENNICVGKAETTSEIIEDNYIELENGEVVEIGYIWDGENWEEGTPPEPETPSPTEDELQWQAITDLEISQMEYDQALTDLELAYLEGSAE